MQKLLASKAFGIILNLVCSNVCRDVCNFLLVDGAGYLCWPACRHLFQIPAGKRNSRKLPDGFGCADRFVSGKGYARDVINFFVIYEPGENNWSAFCPDMPGCVAAGRTRLDTERLMVEALALHLRGQEEDGDVISEPSAIEAGYVSVDFVPHALSSRDHAVALA